MSFALLRDRSNRTLREDHSLVIRGMVSGLLALLVTSSCSDQAAGYVDGYSDKRWPTKSIAFKIDSNVFSNASTQSGIGSGIVSWDKTNVPVSNFSFSWTTSTEAPGGGNLVNNITEGTVTKGRYAETVAYLRAAEWVEADIIFSDLSINWVDSDNIATKVPDSEGQWSAPRSSDQRL